MPEIFKRLSTHATSGSNLGITNIGNKRSGCPCEILMPGILKLWTTHTQFKEFKNGLDISSRMPESKPVINDLKGHAYSRDK